MPELPEVETVRDGVARHVLGSRVVEVEIRRESVARRQAGGSSELARRMADRRLVTAVRRGKFLWLVLDTPAADAVPEAARLAGFGEALMVHLGMSGQLLVRGPDTLVEHPHLRARLHLDPVQDGAPAGRDGHLPAAALDFVDQRTFGHLTVTPLVATPDGAPGGHGSALAAVPEPVAHIARDLLDPALDRDAVVASLRRRRTEVKRALLDQTLVSGIGNIYADEALWRAGVHPRRPTSTMRPATVHAVLDAAAEVMTQALAAGGTSFDALYVDVNGASGYFDRSLAVYGQAGRPCPRCGATVVRAAFMNRSSFTCPACQRPPRRAGTAPRPGRSTQRSAGAS